MIGGDNILVRLPHPASTSGVAGPSPLVPAISPQSRRPHPCEAGVARSRRDGPDAFVPATFVPRFRPNTSDQHLGVYRRDLQQGEIEEGRARRRTADLSLSLYDIPVLPRRTERPSLLLNVDEDPVPTFRERQLTMLKHALSKRTIRCTIQTALLYLVPTLAMCSVAYALGRAGVSHHRERDIHALNALTSSIDAGNVSATIILMKEVRVPALPVPAHPYQDGQ